MWSGIHEVEHLQKLGTIEKLIIALHVYRGMIYQLKILCNEMLMKKSYIGFQRGIHALLKQIIVLG